MCKIQSLKERITGEVERALEIYDGIKDIKEN